ncbi:hypothetical protein A2Y85_03010 [candidate division WOR-3 bacterium RBG_13_43_14]|uniref:Phosphoesterase n=1 Tax=candidate division WOR-3 bacterium RBG_13_43_14 TaxID=1802590 RepID=A0A1F4UBF1_UNCW3|nr:MAG: hypothetical protein A2Y85_03010 [candidate division WOR-3 bacterium RBG_13_43_14]
MKIGVLSDSHHELENVNDAVIFLKKNGAKLIIHLGDDYNDLDNICDEHAIRVPGLYCDAYLKSYVPNRRIEEIEGWTVLLTHTPESTLDDLPDDPHPEDLIKNQEIDIMLYGHTHTPEIKMENDIVYINPGHLKKEDKKGHPATFALIDMSEHKLFITIYKLSDKSVLKEQNFGKE